MKSHVRSGLLVVLTVALLAVPTAANAVTVREFLQSTAQIMGVQPATAEGLSAAGYAVPASGLDRHLTEADVVTIGRALGIRLGTLNPAVVVSERRAARILGYLDTTVTSAQTRSTGEQSGRWGQNRPKRPNSGSPKRPHNGWGNRKTR